MEYLDSVQKFRASGEIAFGMLTPDEQRVYRLWLCEVERLESEGGDLSCDEPVNLYAGQAYCQVTGSERIVKKFYRLQMGLFDAGVG